MNHWLSIAKLIEENVGIRLYNVTNNRGKRLYCSSKAHKGIFTVSHFIMLLIEKGKNLLDQELILFPVHLPRHWILIVINYNICNNL